MRYSIVLYANKYVNIIYMLVYSYWLVIIIIDHLYYIVYVHIYVRIDFLVFEFILLSKWVEIDYIFGNLSAKYTYYI